MREYRQLTEEDRIEIYAMKQAGKQQKVCEIFFWRDITNDFIMIYRDRGFGTFVHVLER